MGSSHVQNRVGVPQVTRDHQKHAESTYLDEYLRFKKNLVEKFPLDIFFRAIPADRPKRARNLVKAGQGSFIKSDLDV